MSADLFFKFLYDVLNSIEGLEEIKDEVKTLRVFKSRNLYKKAAEREFEIIGEAVKNIKVLDEKGIINISNVKNIVGLRNVIAHAYDSVNHEDLWLYMKKFVPVLKAEILENIKNLKNG